MLDWDGTLFEKKEQINFKQSGLEITKQTNNKIQIKYKCSQRWVSFDFSVTHTFNSGFTIICIDNNNEFDINLEVGKTGILLKKGVNLLVIENETPCEFMETLKFNTFIHDKKIYLSDFRYYYINFQKLNEYINLWNNELVDIEHNSELVSKYFMPINWKTWTWHNNKINFIIHLWRLFGFNSFMCGVNLSKNQTVKKIKPKWVEDIEMNILKLSNKLDANIKNKKIYQKNLENSESKKYHHQFLHQNSLYDKNSEKLGEIQENIRLLVNLRDQLLEKIKIIDNRLKVERNNKQKIEELNNEISSKMKNTKRNIDSITLKSDQILQQQIENLEIQIETDSSKLSNLNLQHTIYEKTQNI